jgi:hypothetical protein
MHPKSPKWLDDMADACAFVLEITANVTMLDYASDRSLRQTVERILSNVTFRLSAKLYGVLNGLIPQLPPVFRIIAQ